MYATNTPLKCWALFFSPLIDKAPTETRPKTMIIQNQIMYHMYTTCTLFLVLILHGLSLFSLSGNIKSIFITSSPEHQCFPHGTEHFLLRQHTNMQLWHAIHYKLLNRDKHTSCLISWTKEDSIPLQGLWGFCRTPDSLASTSKWDPRAETQPRAEILLAVRSIICSTIACVWRDEALWGSKRTTKIPVVLVHHSLSSFS